MVQLREELLLVHNGIHTALLNNSRLLHFLHGEELLLLDLLDLPNLAEASAADDVEELEGVLGDSWC